MPKRTRAADYVRDPKKIAAAIGAKYSKRFPLSEYGKAYFKRGTEDNLAMWGPSWKEADERQRADRKLHGYSGRGKYSFMKGLRKFAGGPIGQAIESLAVQQIGKLSGSGGKFSGRGAYNDLVNAPAGADTADTLVLSLREYVGDITVPSTAGAFANVSFQLNPGLQTVFPWLSQIAANYEEYEFIQLLFEYRPTIEASTVGNGQTGSIIMATQYNAEAKPFSDKTSLLQNFGSQSGKITEPATHGVECDPSKVNDKKLYVRSGPVQSGADIKQYDHGILNVAVMGAPSAFVGQQCGELYVVYTVRLRKKKWGVNLGLTIQRDVFQNTNPTSANDPWQYSNFSTMHKGQQNNIGVIVCGRAWPKSLTGLSADIPDVNGTPTYVIFPDNLTGFFKVRFMMEGNSNMTGSMFSSGIATVYGNVKQMRSCICSIGTTSDYTDAPNLFYATGNANHMYYEAEFYVTTATLGQKNYLTLPYGIATGTTLQAFCEVHETNPAFLRSTTNVDACSVLWERLSDGLLQVNP